MSRIADAQQIAEPGEPTDHELGTLLGVGDRPQIREKLENDLKAVRDAERKAERETEGIRLH